MNNDFFTSVRVGSCFCMINDRMAPRGTVYTGKPFIVVGKSYPFVLGSDPYSITLAFDVRRHVLVKSNLKYWEAWCDYVSEENQHPTHLREGSVIDAAESEDGCPNCNIGAMIERLILADHRWHYVCTHCGHVGEISK